MKIIDNYIIKNIKIEWGASPVRHAITFRILFRGRIIAEREFDPIRNLFVEVEK